MSTGQLNLADMKSAQTQQQSKQPVARKSDKDKTIFDFLNGDPKIQKAIGAVAGNFFTADRFLRLAINAVKKTPLLAHCDPQSVLGSFMTSAALGLEPNTVLQQAFLIPYKKRMKQGNDWVDFYECQFQVGARGFITLAHRSPLIKSIQSEAIHEHDHWKHMLGTKSFLEYDKKLKDRGALIGAFCYTVLESGMEMATVLPLDEIYKIRSKSETYNALIRGLDEAGDNAREKAKAQKKFDEKPWVMWEDDMASKSATKKHAKQLPIAPGDSFSVAARLDGDEGHLVEMSTMTDPDLVREVMKNGVDGSATEGASYSFPAVEDAPSPTLNTMQAGSPQADTVVNQSAEQSDGQARAERQGDMVGADDPLFASLKQRLETLTDPDMLDAEADLINEIDDADKQELLTAIYKGRRAELQDPPRSTRQESRPAASRAAMTID